jgi:hypothetical protein
MHFEDISSAVETALDQRLCAQSAHDFREERRAYGAHDARTTMPHDDRQRHGLLPQADASERGVLASMLLDPGQAIRLCVERGLGVRHFHRPAHAIVYEALTFLWGERMLPGDGSDFIPLTEYLRDTGQLADAGGAAYVTELFTYLPTAANVGQYVETVVAKAALRELIALHTRQAERCRTEPAVVWDLVAEAGEGLRTIGERRGHEAMAALLDARAFDAEAPPPEPPAVLSLDEWCVATPENFLVVQAKVKAGKTAVLGAIMAATMAPPHREADCLGFRSENPHGHAVIHFDTEQSRYHHHLVMTRALARAGQPAPPPWLTSYYVKGLSIAQRWDALRTELQRRQRACGGVHLVILDGIADYCRDVNDAEEAVALVGTIEALAVEFATTFIVVIHENPGSEIGKTRGHLGSHLERKAETPLRLEKDADGVTVMYADRARTAHITKEHGVRFSWNDEARMHTRLTAEAVAEWACAQKKRAGPLVNVGLENAKAALGKYFAHGKTHYRTALLLGCGLPEGTFKDYWQRLRAARLLRPNPAVRRLFEATEAWEQELREKYPEEEQEDEWF